MIRATTANVYLDYAAATPIDPDVMRIMRAWDDAHFENAFSTHARGRVAKRALEDARFKMAAHLGVASHECVFVNGATSGTALALHGAIGALLERGVPHADMHVIMGVTEHSSVRACVETLARRGVSVSMIPACADGIIDLTALAAALRDTTVLVISMLVNNELGTIAPLRDIAALIARRYESLPHRLSAAGIRRPLLFVDASQAPLYMPVAPHDLSADLLVIDAHKIYGPKRSGLLFVRHGTPFISLCGLHGSLPHEGTPDVAGALGLEAAYAIAQNRRDHDIAEWHRLKTYFIAALRERFRDVRIHGDPARSVPGILNVSFPGIAGEFLAAQLDVRGIAASAKSACLSAGGEGSYVVQAVDPERANNSIRFSLGRGSTIDDIDYCVSALSDLVPRA